MNDKQAQEDHLNLHVALNHLEQALQHLNKITGTRERALAVTKIQEAQHWIAALQRIMAVNS